MTGDQDHPRHAAITSRHTAIPVALSFCSAFVDVICFVSLFHSFTAFITGTMVIVISELFQPQAVLWPRALILVSFFLSAVLWIRMIRAMIVAQWQVVRVCLAIEAVLLLLFMASAVFLPVGPDWPSSGTALALVFATLAMSLQNALMQLVLRFHFPTTVMTGNFMSFLVSLTFRNWTDDRDGSVRRVDLPKVAPMRYGINLASFVAGGLPGSVLNATIGFWALLVPALVVATIAILDND